MTIRKVAPTPGLRKGAKPGEWRLEVCIPGSTRLEERSGPSADNTGPASPASFEDSRGSSDTASSVGANSARTPNDPVVSLLVLRLEEVCDLLSRVTAERDREARDAANARLRERRLAEHIVELNDEIAALRDLHATGGGE